MISIRLAATNLINLLPNHGINTLPSLPAHPTIQMAVALDNIALIAIAAKGISQDGIASIGALGSQDFIVAAGEQHDGDALETPDVAAAGQFVAERRVGRHEAAVAHLHEEVQQRHADAAKEAVDLPVRGFV